MTDTMTSTEPIPAPWAEPEPERRQANPAHSMTTIDARNKVRFHCTHEHDGTSSYRLTDGGPLDVYLNGTAAEVADFGQRIAALVDPVPENDEHDGTPFTLDLSTLVKAIVDGNTEVVDVDTTAHRSSADVEVMLIDLGGIPVRVAAADLFEAVEEVRCFLAGLMVPILDARQAALDAERHACACGTWLDPDEEFCGDQACRVYLVAERRDEALL